MMEPWRKIKWLRKPPPKKTTTSFLIRPSFQSTSFVFCLHFYDFCLVYSHSKWTHKPESIHISTHLKIASACNWLLLVFKFWHLFAMIKSVLLNAFQMSDMVFRNVDKINIFSLRICISFLFPQDIRDVHHHGLTVFHHQLLHHHCVHWVFNHAIWEPRQFHHCPKDHCHRWIC